jgi:tRNA wybutosine-synthesizing protein 3
MDTFALQKSQCLAKDDRSRRGMVDGQIRPLVRLLNENPDYYTTSSCSGRIVLITREESSRKCDSRWLYVTHGKATAEEISKALMPVPEELVWLRQESFILHAVAKDLDAARKLLSVAAEAGLKHSGICSIGKRIILEIEGNEILEAPVSRRGKLLIDKDYLLILIRAANRKMVSNSKRLRLFTSKLGKK